MKTRRPFRRKHQWNPITHYSHLYHWHNWLPQFPHTKPTKLSHEFNIEISKKSFNYRSISFSFSKSAQLVNMSFNNQKLLFWFFFILSWKHAYMIHSKLLIFHIWPSHIHVPFKKFYKWRITLPVHQENACIFMSTCFSHMSGIFFLLIF